MLFGVGWCVLRTSRDRYATVAPSDLHVLDKATSVADEQLWASFRAWMNDHATPWLLWNLYERHNNHEGLLQFYISRNHRASPVWDMLKWIAEHGTGSYGLFYVHDDEDVVDKSVFGRGITEDFDNVFRVHRILNGALTELADPFFGKIVPDLEPPFPGDRSPDESQTSDFGT